MKIPLLARLHACLAAGSPCAESSYRSGCERSANTASPASPFAAALSGVAKALALSGAMAAVALSLGAPAQAQSTLSVTRNSKIGGNFWFRKPSGETGLENGTGTGTHQVFQPNFDFKSANWNSNPYDQTFLDEIQPYSTLRFMEWNPTNNSTQVDPADRTQMNDPVQQSDGVTPKQYDSYIGNGTKTKGVAYEWQVKLCNLKSTNYWVNIPHLATDAYVRNVADMIRDNLNSGLTVYVEYSNELWLGQAPSGGDYSDVQRQTVYAKNQGYNTQVGGSSIASQITGVDSAIPSDRKAIQGFYVYRSLQVFNLFAQEFGSSGRGRLKFVLAGLVHDGWEMSIWKAALNSSALNPNGTKPDVVATSFYPGYEENIDGSASDALKQLYTAESNLFNNRTKQAKSNATNLFGVPLVIYEAGLGTQNKANILAGNQGMYDYEKQLLTDLTSQADLVMLYCHVSPWQSVNGSTTTSTNAFGLKAYIGQDISNAPSYRALLNWLNGTTSGGGTPTPTPTPTPASSDSANSVSGPTSVNPGKTVTVSVNYSASTARWIWVMLLNKDNNAFTYTGGGGANVSAGSGTVSVSVPVNSDAVLGTNYCWQAQVQTTSGTNVANTAQQDGISVVAASTGGISSSFIGRTISFKSVANGNYVQAQNGSGALIANSGSVGTWEKFQLEDAGNGYVWLKSVSAGKYLWANSDGSAVTTTSTTAQDWERFTISAHPNQTGKYLITAKSNGKYLMLSNGGANPSSDTVLNVSNNAGTWEAFGIDDQGSASDPSNLVAQ